MREVHLMNLIEMHNIIMTSFNKIKFKYLIQVWEDVTKIIGNVKNVDVEKLPWWRHHLNIPPPHYATIVTLLGYPHPPPPVTSFLNDHYWNGGNTFSNFDKPDEKKRRILSGMWNYWYFPTIFCVDPTHCMYERHLSF